MKSVGLFSGIGGLELGLGRSGIDAALLCENWEPAASVLQRRFDAPVVGDIRKVEALPACDVVAAGFPCTDLSQVGRTAGISGDDSGLIREVFRLVAEVPPTWLVLENVPNMLTLHSGEPVRHITDWLDDNGWNWAYRTVDSQYFGVRQRRRRVFLIASRAEDPREVLFADETGGPAARKHHSAYGFYWTEGNRGIGWGEGVTPTLKGGSKRGIASPPGVWIPDADIGKAICRPGIRVGERLQGFRAGWTDGLGTLGERWKMVGNAVTVPVAEWIGHRLMSPGVPVDVGRSALEPGRRWPGAASSVAGKRESWQLSERPIVVRQRTSLAGLLGQYSSEPLSLGATTGFTARLKASTLWRDERFVAALDTHIAAMATN
ncbi:DNA cytosine methyltransferase [Saccharomonospora sp. CUA-673]|uniref:DNA cytosine methyltransferase n=1 Tax=Saccharomonospora sp. CUA-673 TaxID=1904969 RepID=UPI00096AB3C2|nr:DNA (cytosine-5-)-methyltransferase [Saccharomonospora sp. CUA-673]